MLSGRLEGRPIGVISTASEDPAASGESFTQKINEQYGAGVARFLPLGVKGVSAEDPQVVEAVRSCGGFYFTGGQQTRTTRVLLRRTGERSGALAAIWEVYLKGGILGGSSAGAAVMSDPMITGGRSAKAIRQGAARVGGEAEERGVSMGVGLGFHPGVLYCQHHLERARYGRLLTAVVSDVAETRLGIGVCEDTAWVVDHQKGKASVLGANGVLVVDAAAVEVLADGGWNGVRVHYLSAGDEFLFKTGDVVSSDGKEPREVPKDGAHRFAAWEKNGLQKGLRAMAGGDGTRTLVAEDEGYELSFSTMPETRVAASADGGSVTVAGLVADLKVGELKMGLKLPVGKGMSRVPFQDKVIRVFSYRASNYQDGPLLVVMHGMDRNAEDYRDRAVVLAERFGVLVVAPEFDLNQFPVEAYQRGGVTLNGEVQPKESWTFQAVHEVVAAVRKLEQRADLPLYLVGHSAGGQILTRMAAFLPADAVRIVAANPGTLIFPNRDAEFPLGFGGLPDELGGDEALRRYLAAPLTLYLGDQDFECLGVHGFDDTIF
jgi:cyanophycinase